MRKIILFWCTINLTITITSLSLIACDKSTDIINDKVAMFEATKPPQNSKWKLVSDKIQKNDGLWYFQINYQQHYPESFFAASSALFKSNDYFDWAKSEKVLDFKQGVLSLYKWTGTEKPNKPKFDRYTGQIINWYENLK